VASFAMGALAFHEPLPHSVSDLATFSAAAALLACGVVGLAHSPMVREELEGAPDRHERPKKSAVNLAESVAPRTT
jgi:hypothetical protein